MVQSGSAPEGTVKIGYGILGRYPVVTLISFIVTGVGIGIGLSYWRPAEGNEETKEIVL